MQQKSNSGITVKLPSLHSAQKEILASASRFNVVICGRRWGKTVFGINQLAKAAIEGKQTAWFAPVYKQLLEPWREVNRILAPVITKTNSTERRIELITGGTIDFWSLDNPETIRGRKYHLAISDESAATPNFEKAWNEVLRPTLVDYRGIAWFLTTPKGKDFVATLFERGQGEDHPEWKSWRYPTITNPFISPKEIDCARVELPERVFLQEFLAEFIDDAGGVFRKVANAIDRGRNEPDEWSNDKQYVIGVDLARINDFTVITVLDYDGRQCYWDRFNQISWEIQLGRILAVAKKFRGARLIVDSTGVGDPIVERLRLAGLPVRAYQMTNSSKEKAVNSLSIRLEAGGIRLMDMRQQEHELKAYQYEITEARNVRMNAPEGEHDDCVIALSLACTGLPRASARGQITGESDEPGRFANLELPDEMDFGYKPTEMEKEQEKRTLLKYEYDEYPSQIRLEEEDYFFG